MVREGFVDVKDCIEGDVLYNFVRIVEDVEFFVIRFLFSFN